MKKVFSYIKKVFSEPEVERYAHCIYCGKELTGSKRKFCSVACNNSYWRGVYSKKIRGRDKAHTKIETKIRHTKDKPLKRIKCEFCDNPVIFLCWTCYKKVHANNIELKGGK